MAVATDSPTRVSVQIGDSEISFETGKLAKQASGAVWVQSGKSSVLSAATGRPEAREGADFFPLTVDVEEKMYAAGKIPGGFFKREGRSGEKATLTARMIDRPIRPLWPKGFRNEVQIVNTVMSVDMVNAHDILAINGSSAALMISELPFMGPIGAVRVGLFDGDFKVNPTLEEMETSELDLLVCGSLDAITMVECGAEIVPEETIVEGLEFAHEQIKKLCQAQIELTEKVGKAKWTDQATIEDFRSRYTERIDEAIQKNGIVAASEWVNDTLVSDASPSLSMSSTEEDIVARTRAKMTLGILFNEAVSSAAKAIVKEQFGDKVSAMSDAEQDSKELKSAKRNLIVQDVLANVKLSFPGGAEEGFDATTASALKAAVDALYKEIVRKKIAVDKRRPDGRSEKEIRPIACEVGVVPRTHGSGLFTRGQTQVLSLCTLGTPREEQRIDDLSLQTNKYYMHHYNFPPFSVGETGFMRGPKRRDIGHGALAERALVAVIPDLEDFPYTIRIVSETLESNGSSSMASVCGSTLSLLDVGVPIKAPVAGIAMGLIVEGDDYVILTDIQGAEDHLGDMDFKVAGTQEGITALQLDIKITGLTSDLLREALEQAREARLSILDTMAATIGEPRAELNENAPRIEITQVEPDQIGMVIGKGGETIRGLESDYECQIDIQEDGQIRVYGANAAGAKGCVEAIENITKPIEVGDEFEGTVVKMAEFGAFVELKKGTDGLLHVSRMGPDRVENPEDIMKRGDVIGVKVVEVDPSRGRIGLVWIKDQEGNPVEIREEKPRAPREGGDRGDRGGRGRGGDRQGGGRPRHGGNRSGGGGRSGGGRPRGEGGGQGGSKPRSSSNGGGSSSKPRSEGGNSRPRANRNGNGGGEGGGNRPPRARASRNDAPAPKSDGGDSGGLGRLFRRGKRED